jgi:hypothetical protein
VCDSIKCMIVLCVKKYGSYGSGCLMDFLFTVAEVVKVAETNKVQLMTIASHLIFHVC